MAAYIEVETKVIWFWQAWHYMRKGWTVYFSGAGFLRCRAEMVIG